MSVLEKLKALDDQQSQIDEQRAKIRDEAKAELLAEGNRIVESLKSLGFNYALTEGGAAKGKKGSGIKRPMKDQPCPICKFKTTPRLHDARAHRSQEVKKPFTKAELAQMGLSKVEQ